MILKRISRPVEGLGVRIRGSGSVSGFAHLAPCGGDLVERHAVPGEEGVYGCVKGV